MKSHIAALGFTALAVLLQAGMLLHGNARPAVAAATASRPMNPAYLGEMPSVERVKAEIRGRNRTDTAARQMGAFWQLQKIIETLAGPRFYRTRTPDENQLIGQYRAGYAAAAQPIEWKRRRVREQGPGRANGRGGHSSRRRPNAGPQSEAPRSYCCWLSLQLSSLRRSAGGLHAVGAPRRPARQTVTIFRGRIPQGEEVRGGDPVV